MEPHWPSVTAGLLIGFVLATVAEIITMASFFLMARWFAKHDIEPD